MKLIANANDKVKHNNIGIGFPENLFPNEEKNKENTINKTDDPMITRNNVEDDWLPDTKTS